AACARCGAREVSVVSRSGALRYDMPELFRDAEIVINTTPVGMSPNTDAAPVDLRGFSQLEAVADVIYNPLRSRLIQRAEELSVKAAPGLYMLVAQALRAAELFTGRELSSETERIYAALRRNIENIALIGMPGCGKTAVGAALAALTGRTFLDTDALVEERTKKSIPAIFAEEGESAFRALEREAVADCGACTGVVIAAGGGAPLFAENRAALRQNSRVFLIERDLLATEGRPLSKDAETLKRMATERAPYYAACADARIKNNAAPEDAARKIWELFNENSCD
ncbi:MAG: shikimate kinase, partial [Firmicutes bacterium]|nr:shikimate kinase [Bacillota bacterium]